jgi:hypothetical protein
MPEVMTHMMRNALFIVMAVAVFLAFYPIGQTRAEEAYFEALYDIPVMPGLEEIKGEAILFDKPDGRIASAVAASRTLKPVQVRGFYAESLIQMGWKKTAQNQYVRGEDLLTVDVQEKPPLTVVHFTLSPLKP